MSSEWETGTLGQFIELKRGYDLPQAKRVSGIYPLVSSSGVTDTHHEPMVKGPGVVTGRYGTIGKVFFVSEDFWPLNTTLYVRDFKGNDPKFISYFLQTIDFLAYSDKAAVPGVNRNHLHEAMVSMPNLVIQKQIASVLSALDDRIALLRETNATLEAIAQALFKSWFVDFEPVHAKARGESPQEMDDATAALFPDSFEESELGMIPKGWRVKHLGDVTDRITKGTTPTTLKKPFVNEGINFVKVESITATGELLPEKFAFIDDETHLLLKRSQLEAGDILITIAGTIGRVAEISEDHIPANTNQAVALIRPVYNLLPGGLIKRFLQGKESKQRMSERIVQAVQANLSLGSLSDMQMVVPPSDTVTLLYDAGLSAIDAGIKQNRRKIQTLAQLRDTLLPKLISGQLRLPEAQVLLAEELP